MLNSGRLMAPDTEPSPNTGTGTEPVKATITIGGKEFTPAQAESAISLYNSLSDPDTGREIVETLAKRLGLIKDGHITEPEGKVKGKLEGKITKQLKQKLGKDYEKFSELVGPALDEAIGDLIAEHRGSVTEELSQQQWSAGVDRFLESHDFPEGVEGKMKELIDEAPPNTKSKSFDQQKYLSRMYKNACEELEISVPRAKSKRSNDDEGEEGMPPKVRVIERPSPKSGSDRLDQIVEDAMNGRMYKRG